MSLGVESVRAVGYWNNALVEPKRFIFPQKLVDPMWEKGARNRIGNYLRGGMIMGAVAAGFSRCRFECGVKPHAMGNRECTDGTWFWPEGLVHYIERHDVRLPDEFIATMRANRFIPPTPIESMSADLHRDWDFWTDWCKKQGSEGTA